VAAPVRAQGRVGTVELGREPVPFEIAPHVVEPGRPQAGKRLPTPQPQRLVQQRQRVLGRPRVLDEPVKPVQVNAFRVDGQQVATRAAVDGDAGNAGHGLPQAVQIAVEGVASGVRRLVGWRRPEGS
jgi:hypothetical protein